MKSFLILLIASMASISLYAQVPTQTVRGRVLDRITERPLEAVTITLLPENRNAITDSSGTFIFPDVPVGRHSIQLSSVNYMDAAIPELLLTAGKELVLPVYLDERLQTLSEVRVSSNRNRKGAVNNEYASGSARSFNLEEVTRFAGGRNDPSKLVSNFAGVVANNDSRNDIVVRGNSPAGVLWRIEGLPSPNPNHFSALGTTGGPVTMLNTNALQTSDFYSGAFPAEFGNALSAVFDIRLRPGNTEKQERTLQVNLFSGLEAMLEGPLGKKKKGASYVLGYRYSFVQIGKSLGLNVGTEAVPKYQDWVAHIRLAPSKFGRFSFYTMGGRSNISFLGAEIDTSDFFSRKDQDTYFESNSWLAGVEHQLDLGKKSYLRTVVSYSRVSSAFRADQYPLPVPPYEDSWLITQSRNRIHTMRASSLFNHKVNNKLSYRVGGTVENFDLSTFLKDREGLSAADSFRIQANYDNSFALWQFFAQARYRATEKWSFVLGLHEMLLVMNRSTSLEPRASIQFSAGKTDLLSLSYGLHAQLQPFPVYFYETTENGQRNQANRELGFSRAHHFVLSYEKRFGLNWRAKGEAYYQYLFNIPVERTASGFSMINAGSDFTFPEKTNLVNTGTGYNAGLELTLEKFLTNGVYLLATGSVFDSRYKGSDNLLRNTTFNYHYAGNMLAGKEWKLGSEKRKAITIDLRVTSIGGKYYTPIDRIASAQAKREILDESQYNSVRIPGYFRLDSKFGIRIDGKKRKVSQTLYLDLQNVTNRKNIFLRRYNALTGLIADVYQIGFFPDILYRIQF